jgi:glycosyltransferase involved in cell wall biosynthesis
MARVLLTDSYGLRFNSPRNSRHTQVWKNFNDGSKLRFRGLLPLNPFNSRSFDLLHTFNGIPWTRKPWLILFESYLPRTFGKRAILRSKILRERLLLPNCRKLIAMSEYARRKFVYWNAGWNRISEALAKMVVMHPNLPLRQNSPRTYSGGRLEVLFVGNHFARKGGITALRLASLASKHKLPIRLHIVSGLADIGEQYTDYPGRARYDADLELLKLDNVVFHNSLPNSDVLKLMSECHLLLLPTIDDTFGFSALEGFSYGMPCLATAVCALPEIVKPGVNGHLLSMPTDENGNWKFLNERRWEILDETYTRLAQESLGWIETLLAKPRTYETLSAGAIEQVRQHHSSSGASARFDEIYAAALAFD